MTVHLVTSCNAAYIPKMQPYLDTLNKNGAGLKLWLCCVGFEPVGELGNITAVTVPLDDLAGAPPETQSLQHGGWLPYIDAQDDDTVIFTDGDLFLQRELSAAEMESLNIWPGEALGASYNMGPQETLLHEALFKLHPKVGDGEFLNEWGRKTMEGLCLNVGVMVARKKTHRRIYDRYMLDWERIGQYLTHQARQQWLIAYSAFKLGLEVMILPYHFHMHYHFALPDGALVGKAGEAYFNNILVAFWHLPTWARGKA